jgi:hypothetical protein
MKWMKLLHIYQILFIWKWNLEDDCIVMVHYEQGVFFSNNNLCHFIALQTKKTKIKGQRKKAKRRKKKEFFLKERSRKPS